MVEDSVSLSQEHDDMLLVDPVSVPVVTAPSSPTLSSPRANNFIEGSANILAKAMGPKKNRTSLNPPETRQTIVIVTFYSPLCAYSARLLPVMKAIADTFPQARHLKINGEEHFELTSYFFLSGFPSVFLFGANHYVEYKGVARSYDSIVSFIQFHTKLTPVFENVSLLETMRTFNSSAVPESLPVHLSSNSSSSSSSSSSASPSPVPPSAPAASSSSSSESAPVGTKASQRRRSFGIHMLNFGALSLEIEPQLMQNVCLCGSILYVGLSCLYYVQYFVFAFLGMRRRQKQQREAEKKKAEEEKEEERRKELRERKERRERRERVSGNESKEGRGKRKDEGIEEEEVEEIKLNKLNEYTI